MLHVFARNGNTPWEESKPETKRLCLHTSYVSPVIMHRKFRSNHLNYVALQRRGAACWEKRKIQCAFPAWIIKFAIFHSFYMLFTESLVEWPISWIIPIAWLWAQWIKQRLQRGSKTVFISRNLFHKNTNGCFHVLFLSVYFIFFPSSSLSRTTVYCRLFTSVCLGF